MFEKTADIVTINYFFLQKVLKIDKKMWLLVIHDFVDLLF